MIIKSLHQNYIVSYYDKNSNHAITYLPWCGYFKLMAEVDKFVILDTVQFEKEVGNKEIK